MIDRSRLSDRRDQLATQRDEMVAADKAEHERMVWQIAATVGALQFCETLIAELDVESAQATTAAPAAEPEGVPDGR
jgi:hypothetical protein